MRTNFDTETIGALAKRVLGQDIKVSSVDEGISTSVYRVVCGNDTFYFRIAAEGENYTPEATVHEWLLSRNIPVPKVIYYENFTEQLGRSFIITREIPGLPVNQTGDALSPVQLEEILFSAGVALAQINSMPLEGFGWIDRDGKTINTVKGMHDSYIAFIFEELENKAEILLEKKLISNDEEAKIHSLIKKLKPHLDYKQGYLAHGDLDTGHIYVHEGKFSGFIDFGDIRSTDPYYDLAHFQIYDPSLFLYLIEGYNTQVTLPDDFAQKLAITKFFIAIHGAGWVAKHLNYKHGKLLKHPKLLAVKEGLEDLEKYLS